MVFAETIADLVRTFAFTTPGVSETSTVILCHELAHEFGLAHSGGLVAPIDVLRGPISLSFTDEQLNYLRWRVHSPGCGAHVRGCVF